MNALSRIPVYAWYLFSVAYCYAVWNPYASLWQLAQSDVDPAVKALSIVVALIVISVYLVEGHRSMNPFGITLFLALMGTIFWLAFNTGFRGFGSIHLWGQWVVGLLMTVALQGGRIYRSMTGRVPVGTGNVDHDAHGHGHQ